MAEIISLETKDITYSHDGSSVYLINNISLEIRKGQIIAITGENAAGKSTLGRLIKGYLEPFKGMIVVNYSDGKIDNASNKYRILNIGWACARAEIQLFANTIYDDIAFAPRNQGLAGENLHTRVNWAMEVIGLTPQSFSGRSPLQLSGGEKRRVALAGIIAMKCSFYIFDEPTAGLDDKGICYYIDMIDTLKNDNCGILWITHEERLAMEYSDQVWRLSGGDLARHK